MTGPMTTYDTKTLEYKLLYAVIVAAKSARFTDGVMPRLGEALTSLAADRHLWFPAIRNAIQVNKLSHCLRQARTGRYTSTQRAFTEIVSSDIDLRACTITDLVRIHGIGPKTARAFLNSSGRPGRFAVLDVHILRWLSERGYVVPRHTPLPSKYVEIESWFLREADQLGMQPSEFDRQIWLERNKSGIRE